MIKTEYKEKKDPFFEEVQAAVYLKLRQSGVEVIKGKAYGGKLILKKLVILMTSLVIVYTSIFIIPK
jgi:hypothetical protein